MAKRMVPKVVTGKEAGGWSEAGRRGIPRVCSVQITIEARNKSRGPLRALPASCLIKEPFLGIGQRKLPGVLSIIRPGG